MDLGALSLLDADWWWKLPPSRPLLGQEQDDVGNGAAQTVLDGDQYTMSSDMFLVRSSALNALLHIERAHKVVLFVADDLTCEQDLPVSGRHFAPSPAPI